MADAIDSVIVNKANELGEIIDERIGEMSGIPVDQTAQPAGAEEPEAVHKQKFKLSASKGGKIFAFLILLISALIAAAAAVCIFVAWETDCYTKDYKTVLSTALRGDTYAYFENVVDYMEEYGAQMAAEYMHGTNAELAILKAADKYAASDSVFVWQSYDKTEPTGFYSNLYVDIEKRLDGTYIVSEPGTYIFRFFYDPAFGIKDNAQFTEKLISAIYSFRYELIAALALSLVFCIWALCFLLAGAGHKNGVEGIVPGPLTKCPLDLLALILLCLAGVAISILEYADGNVDIKLAIFCLVFGILGVFCLCDLAIRLKMGKWWRNTLIYRFLHMIFSLCRMFFNAMRGKFVLVCLAFLGLCFAEGITIIIVDESPEVGLFCWCIVKAFELGLITYLAVEARKLYKAGQELAAGNENARVDTEHMLPSLKAHGENLNNIGKGITKAVEERMKSEHMKTELISNVSHDIKTPLTSIINYADLISHEQTENPVIMEYAEVIGRQSLRLKKLLEDLVEASKATTGTLEVNPVPCEVGVLLSQAVGEYQQRMEDKNLDLRVSCPEEEVMILADGKHLWRVFDNLLNNICKYAQENSRVFLTLEKKEDRVTITFRNMSKYLLEMTPDELSERFVRGDKSRHKEGNGLGLSIAKNLTELQNGSFDIFLDGDLFKVVLTFPALEQKN